MQYTRTAITQLTRWYKQVLRKCKICNLAILAGEILISTPVWAGINEAITNGTGVTDNKYQLTEDESINSGGVTLGINELTIYSDIINQKSIAGSQDSGITIGSGKKLDVYNSTFKDFGTVLNSNGTVTLKNIRFENTNKMINNGNLYLIDTDLSSHVEMAENADAITYLSNETIIQKDTTVNQKDVYVIGASGETGTFASQVQNDGTINAEKLTVNNLTITPTEGPKTNIFKNTGEVNANINNEGGFINSGKVTGNVSNKYIMGIGSILIEETGEEQIGVIHGDVENDGELYIANSGKIEGNVTSKGTVVNSGTITGVVNNKSGCDVDNLGTIMNGVNNEGNLENIGTITGVVNNKSDGYVNNFGTIMGVDNNEGYFENHETITDGVDNEGHFENYGTIKGAVKNTADLNAYRNAFYNSGTIIGDVTNGIENSDMASFFGSYGTIDGNVTNYAKDAVPDGLPRPAAWIQGKVTGNVLNETDATMIVMDNDNVQNSAIVDGNITNKGVMIVINANNVAKKEGATISNTGDLTFWEGNLTKDIANTAGGKLTLADVSLANDIAISGEGQTIIRNGSQFNLASNTLRTDNEVVFEGGQAQTTIGMVINKVSGDGNYEGGKIIQENSDSVDVNGADLKIAFNSDILSEQGSSIENLNLSAFEGIGDVSTTGTYEIKKNSEGKYVVTNKANYADTSAVSVGGSVSNQKTAEAWNNAKGLSRDAVEGAVQKALNIASRENPVQYVKALTDLAPTNTAVHMGVTQDFNNQVAQEVSDRLSSGMSSGDAYENGGVWVQTLYNRSKQNETRQTPGFKSHTAGVAMGFDGSINSKTTVGVGYAYGKSDIDSGGRDTDVKSHNFFVYGKYKPSQWFVKGMANYGTAKYDEKANIMGYANKGKYDVDNYGFRTSVGYDFANGITPEAGLRYTHIKQDDYTDTMHQHIRSDDIDIMTAVAGVNYVHKIAKDDFVFTPSIHLAATYDLTSDDSNAVVGVGNTIYRVKGDKLNRLGFETGLNAAVDIDDWTLSAEYDLGLREDYTSHTGMLKAKYNF